VWSSAARGRRIHNNVNGIDGDANGDGVGKEVHRSPTSQVLNVQEAYVRKVLDTLHDLDNVLYEVVNEAIPESVPWQYHFIRFIKQYERDRQYAAHPVGMTFFQLGEFGGGDNATLFDSPADWISPGGYTKYARNPPVADGRKVMLLDTDHIHGIGGDQDFVWESFFRGYNPIYMDPLGALHELTIGEPVLNEPQHERARMAMGEARRWAERLDLKRTLPHEELASTGYCLADPGQAYLVYVPASASSHSTPDVSRPLTVNLTGAVGGFVGEWIDLEQDSAALREQLLQARHGLFPVASGELDKLSGVARARDLLADVLATGSIDLSRSLRQPLVVPTSVNVIKLVEQMRHSRAQIALVSDEFGSILGLVTPIDLLEAIAGEFPEEGELPDIQPQATPGHWVVDGQVDLHALETATEIYTLAHSEDYSTLAGFLLDHLEQLPAVGQVVEAEGLRFEVLEMDKRRIALVDVRRIT